MALPITSFYAAIFALVFLILTFNVIFRRAKLRVGIGDKNDERLKRKIRAHGNFAEYTPFFVVLLALLEIQGNLGKAGLCYLGMFFLLGRLLHFYGIVALKYKNLKFLQGGMAVTVGCYIFAAVRLLMAN